MQELLWVLVSLADDDLVYKDDMRDAGLPALLVSLLSVYQANQGAAELRPIAAQILRCLQLMAAGDEAMQVCVTGGPGRQDWAEFVRGVADCDSTSMVPDPISLTSKVLSLLCQRSVCTTHIGAAAVAVATCMSRLGPMPP